MSSSMGDYKETMYVSIYRYPVGLGFYVETLWAPVLVKALWTPVPLTSVIEGSISLLELLTTVQIIAYYAVPMFVPNLLSNSN